MVTLHKQFWACLYFIVGERLCRVFANVINLTDDNNWNAYVYGVPYNSQSFHMSVHLINTTIIIILQTRRPRLRRMMKFVQGHTAMRGQSQDLKTTSSQNVMFCLKWGRERDLQLCILGVCKGQKKKKRTKIVNCLALQNSLLSVNYCSVIELQWEWLQILQQC